jgi:hypothetical protein
MTHKHDLDEAGVIGIDGEIYDFVRGAISEQKKHPNEAETCVIGIDGEIYDFIKHAMKSA